MPERSEQVELPAQSETLFKPGGLHLMVFGLERALKADDELPVTLSLANGAQLQVVGRVRGVRRWSARRRVSPRGPALQPMRR